MESRRLGRTQLNVCAAGVHASWRERDVDDARKTLTAAMERGVDVVIVDPAFERALEKIVGEVVRDLRLRDKAQIVTRVGAPEHPRAVQARVEESLRATKLEVLPFAVVEWDDRTFYEKLWPETRAALERLVREGKVLRWGIAPRPDSAMGTSEAIFELVVLPYSVLARGAEAIFASAKRHDAGVVITQPLEHGLLGGAWNRDTVFKDWRRETYKELAPHLAKIEKLRPLATRETDDLAELALRFAFGREEASVVAPSIRTRDQLETLVRAADGRRLSESLLQRVDEETGVVS
ncbi:MAG TPA: aldo/keto reductase [Kofleriaceae bacterium]|nr:aldo/keto reductase [Kofleriaceae bacterium]